MIVNPEKIFPVRLRLLRRGLKLSQAELADRTDLSSHWIQKLERGRGNPRLDTLRRLALELKTSTDYLTGLSHESAPR